MDQKSIIWVVSLYKDNKGIKGLYPKCHEYRRKSLSNSPKGFGAGRFLQQTLIMDKFTQIMDGYLYNGHSTHIMDNPLYAGLCYVLQQTPI